MSIRKMIEQKRQYWRYKARKEALPADYRAVLDAVDHYVMYFAGDGDALLALLEDLVEVFEQAAADRTPITDLVGDDPVEFAEGFLRNYAEASWLHKERRRLTSAVRAVTEPDADAGSADDGDRP